MVKPLSLLSDFNIYILVLTVSPMTSVVAVVITQSYKWINSAISTILLGRMRFEKNNLSTWPVDSWLHGLKPKCTVKTPL